MLEAEISVDGDVYVEGHHVGQLAGFRFVPDQTAEGPDAKAVLAAAQKALALEFEARAARLHASGNGDFVFGSDGVIRWLGDPLAKLAEADSIMRPRVILLADEGLSGSAREFVAARLERFVNHHISTVLKPLDDLAHADDLEGLAKGVAFQIVEGLGVLFRRDVADEIKALDQSARGSLRRYGVRFGAYHVFMPMLLKPAPAELITLLWALKNDGFDKPGYGDVIAMLAAGRTSIVTDPAFERAFYKLAGFRFLGKRAVRIDILERLSDLIRPALQWKPGTGARPEGGYDGRRFTVTPAMLSILGATPDDMEEILKGLGYRADSIPPDEAAAHVAALDEPAGKPADENVENTSAKPADPQPVVQASETAAAASAASQGEPEPDASAGGQPGSDDTATPTQAPASEAAPEEAAASAERETASSPADDTAAPSADAASQAAGDDAGKTASPETAEEPPRPVLLWRPLGRGDQARGRNHRSRPGQQADKGADDRQEHRNDKGSGKRFGKGKGGGKRTGKPGDHPDAQKHGRRGGGQRHESRPPRKEKPIDPDSPFAKLAALKEQMKK